MKQEKEKQKGIGTLDFFCMGFGAIVGCGWALSLNKWMANAGGPLPASLGYLAALIMMIPIGLCYSELSPMLPVAGGGAAFAYKAFGEKISFISGWAAFGGYLAIIPWEAIYVVDVISNVFPSLKAGDPLYTLGGAGIYAGHIVIGTIFSLLFFYINLRGISVSAVVQNILCFVLLGCGILAILASLGRFDISNWLPVYENIAGKSHSNFAGGTFAIVATAAFFLSGFETIPQAVEEAAGDDDKTKAGIGKTVLLSIFCACVFYAALLFFLGAAMPWTEFYLLESPAAANIFLHIYGGTGGQVLYFLVLIGATAGMLTTWNGFMMATPRIMLSMARAHMLPHIFAKEHKKYKTPVYGLVFCLIVSIAGPFLGMGLIDPITSLSSTGLVASWMITCYCLIRLRKTEPGMHRPYKVPGGVGMGWFASIVTTIVFVCMFIPATPMYQGSVAIMLFVIWIVIGALCWLVTGKDRRAIPAEQREAEMFAKMLDAAPEAKAVPEAE